MTTPRTPLMLAGDNLTRDDFERRYAAMPDLKQAELIEGVVYTASPVRYAQHGAYVPGVPNRGTYVSQRLPGLCLPVAAALCQDLAALHAAVAEDCATAEHAAFAARTRGMA